MENLDKELKGLAGEYTATLRDQVIGAIINTPAETGNQKIELGILAEKIKEGDTLTEKEERAVYTSICLMSNADTLYLILKELDLFKYYKDVDANTEG